MVCLLEEDIMSKSVLYNGKVYVERDVIAEAVYQVNEIIK